MLLDIFNIFLCSNVKDILTSDISDVPGVKCVGTDCKKLLVCQSFEYSNVDQMCTATMKTVTCDDVRPSGHYDLSSLASHPSDTHCPGHFQCRKGEYWELVKVHCVPHISFFGDTLPNRSLEREHVVDLGFNLQPGMRVTWELAQKNRKRPPPRPSIFLRNPDSHPCIYMVSLRLWNRNPVVVFNTHLGVSGYGLEERSTRLRPKNYAHFVVDVIIGIGIFQTYLDGSFLMNNSMRVRFAGVRFVGADKVSAWRKLQVAFDRC